MLKIDSLHQYYGGSHILRGLSFEAKVGEVTCLLGRNGVGKTTLLRCLMGLVPAREGKVSWEGKPITGLKPHQRVHAGIAYVPQGREIFPRLTVEENLLMGLSRFSAGQAKTVPEPIYELFPVLREMKQRRGGDLSGGQQQQLAIGRALASRPRLLILDEPTEGIQPSVIKEIGAVIRKLAERGDMAILLVEQFYDFAAELADQYLVMSRGEIVQQGRGADMEAEGVRGLVAI
nr:urea ABC transporter ATP-binding subunit UrtE [uncultured Pseudomonas sp.]